MISSTHSAQILTDPRSCDAHISLSCTSPLLHAVSYSGCCSRLPVKFGPLACDRISTFPECFFRQNCRERAACNIPTQQPGIGLACLKILSECSVIACSKELWAISILAAPSAPALWCRVVKLSASPYQVSDVSVVRQASKTNDGWSTIFVVKLISFRVFVCVWWFGGEEGKRNVIEVTMAIQFQNTPPSTLIHKHTLPSASLTPIPSLEQKSKYFWEEFPRSWRLRRVSPTDLSEVWVNVFPAGDPCSHMHPHRSAEHGSYTKQC